MATITGLTGRYTVESNHVTVCTHGCDVHPGQQRVSFTNRQIKTSGQSHVIHNKCWTKIQYASIRYSSIPGKLLEHEFRQWVYLSNYTYK